MGKRKLVQLKDEETEVNCQKTGSKYISNHAIQTPGGCRDRGVYNSTCKSTVVRCFW